MTCKLVPDTTTKKEVEKKQKGKRRQLTGRHRDHSSWNLDALADELG